MHFSIGSNFGLEIQDVALADPTLMQPLTNLEILSRHNNASPKLENFLQDNLGCDTRYHVDSRTTSLDLARSALERLLANHPGLRDEASFLIFAGISNPMPTVCLASFLAQEFGLQNASCWDLKSGCSSGVLALIQASHWLNAGASTGIVIAAETLSKFSPPDVAQMYATVGDGAAAVLLRKNSYWKIHAMVHGTDSRHMKMMYVPGLYPYAPDDGGHRFCFQDKSSGLAAIEKHWLDSLGATLVGAKWQGSDVDHYIAHQPNQKMPLATASACNIKQDAVQICFPEFGNMGSPTVFYNFHKRFIEQRRALMPGETLILQAVGGGISWATVAIRNQE